MISPCFLAVMILVAIFGSAVSAQTGSLSGRVLKNSGGSPLAGVLVSLFQGNDPQIADDDAWTHVASTSTNSDGEYRFDSRSQRRYRVHVGGQAIGGTNYFEANLFNVQVLNGSETANMDLRLRQAGLL
ncbi:MAG: carboxypeptidase regulatory-like domain-containing protein, partial [Planctomycetes bacterium]|nr:carboxypeptidase regulatory-like domain-containing protein [Planctomycetota bacterium]